MSELNNNSNSLGVDESSSNVTSTRKKSVCFNSSVVDNSGNSSSDFYARQKRTGSVFLKLNDLTEVQKAEMNLIFDLFDFDNDGCLNKEDLSKIYETINVNKNYEFSANSFIANATNKENNTVNYSQFANYFAGSYYGKFNTIELLSAFRLFDADKKGYIEEYDLLRIFRRLNWQDKIDAKKILTDMDYNQDGKVCLKDFSRMMNNNYYYFPY